jgi:hypothetical protein
VSLTGQTAEDTKGTISTRRKKALVCSTGLREESTRVAGRMGNSMA